MPIRLANEPPGPLYRVGRAPDPLAWPPREVAGSGRHGDPEGAFAVLYAAVQRRGAFVETLAMLRPAVADLAAARSLPRATQAIDMPLAG